MRKAQAKKEKRAAEHERFMVIDGSGLASIKELAKALDSMSDDAFYYHVNEGKNDFANWVEHVFGEKQLAEKLFDAKTREQALIVILKHMVRM